MSEPYDHLMSQGRRKMEAGNFYEAAKCFYDASVSEQDQKCEANALRMLGVCERLMGDRTFSELSFRTALRLVATNGSYCRLQIMRDLAQLHLDNGEYQTAYNLAMESHVGLMDQSLLREIAVSLQTLQDEAYLSLSVAAEARIHLDGRKKEGLDTLWTAYVMLILGDNDPYKLDAAIRLLRYSFEDRIISGAPRLAFKIARRQGNKRRMAEIVILTLAGRRTYNLLERLYRA